MFVVVFGGVGGGGGGVEVGEEVGGIPRELYG